MTTGRSGLRSSRSPHGVWSISPVLDVGLVAFLVIPGTLPASQGLIGPGLVVASLVGGYQAHRATHPTTLTV